MGEKIYLTVSIEKTPWIYLVAFSISNKKGSETLFYDLSSEYSFYSDIRITWWASQDVLGIKEDRDFKKFESDLFKIRPRVCWFQSRLTQSDTFNLTDLKYLPQLIEEVGAYVKEYAKAHGKNIHIETQIEQFDAEINTKKNNKISLCGSS